MWSLVTHLMDLIYPPRCLICSEFLWEGMVFVNGQRLYLCEPCLSSFPVLESPFCLVCGRPLDHGGPDKTCKDCFERPPEFDLLISPYRYEDPVAHCIHQFKYSLKPNMGKSLGILLGDFSMEVLGGVEDPVLVPVPLHSKRLRKRGFNQSLILAKEVAKILEWELDFLSLRRTKFTMPQVDLQKKERIKNVKGAFEISNPEKFRGKGVILVDDVATTGSTLHECARVLKKAGAQEVVALVFARAVI
ncbi:MAG TPA: ComF family protein [Desulfobacterales bacterium]|nr:ComF family protein [Desulfobacterales bacterium]